MNLVLFTAMLYNFNKTFRRCEFSVKTKSIRHTPNNANPYHRFWPYFLSRSLICQCFWFEKLRQNHCIIKFFMKCNRFSEEFKMSAYSLHQFCPSPVFSHSWSKKIHQKWCRIRNINCCTYNWYSYASSYSAAYRFFRSFSDCWPSFCGVIKQTHTYTQTGCILSVGFMFVYVLFGGLLSEWSTLSTLCAQWKWTKF